MKVLFYHGPVSKSPPNLGVAIAIYFHDSVFMCTAQFNQKHAICKNFLQKKISNISSSSSGFSQSDYLEPETSIYKWLFHQTYI